VAFALLVDSIGPDTQHHLYVGNHGTPGFLERPLKAICHYRWNEYQFKPQFLRQRHRIGDPWCTRSRQDLPYRERRQSGSLREFFGCDFPRALGLGKGVCEVGERLHQSSGGVQRFFLVDAEDNLTIVFCENDS